MANILDSLKIYKDVMGIQPGGKLPENPIRAYGPLGAIGVYSTLLFALALPNSTFTVPVPKKKVDPIVVYPTKTPVNNKTGTVEHELSELDAIINSESGRSVKNK